MYIHEEWGGGIVCGWVFMLCGINWSRVRGPVCNQTSGGLAMKCVRLILYVFVIIMID